MVRVCVVGGGTAGSEAALEASALGAEVTLVEKSERPAPPWGTWPDLIRAFGSGTGKPCFSWARGGKSPAKTLTSQAKSAGKGAVATARGDVACDFTVLATGSSFDPPNFQGSRKAGVAVLDSHGAYEELGRTAGSAAKTVVSGEGGRCLEVAERMNGDGTKVQAFVSCWQHGPPSPVSLEVISGAASEAGVSVVAGTLERTVGASRMEAAIVDGRVIPCDLAVVVPRRIPRVLQTQARLGPAGGILVDRSLRTSAPASFAAGGCAELGGEAVPRVLDREASMSGRIAGANSLGRGLSVGRAGLEELVVFGLRWTRAWATCSRRLLHTSRAAVVGRRWGRRAACELVYERSSKLVLGVELVEPAAAPPSGPLPLGASLKSLAYGYGSSDISAISETARLGLTWQGYSSATTSRSTNWRWAPA